MHKFDNFILFSEPPAATHKSTNGLLILPLRLDFIYSPRPPRTIAVAIVVVFTATRIS